MSLVDILILVILGVFLVKGVLRGLLKEICSLLGLVLGGVFAFTLYPMLAATLGHAFGFSERINNGLAVLAIFLGVVLVFAVIGMLLHRFVKVILLGGVNRLAGALFGLIQGVVILSLVGLALSSSVAPNGVRGLLGESRLAPPFVSLGRSLYQGGQRALGR